MIAAHGRHWGIHLSRDVTDVTFREANRAVEINPRNYDLSTLSKDGGRSWIFRSYVRLIMFTGQNMAIPLQKSGRFHPSFRRIRSHSDMRDETQKGQKT